MNTKKQTELRCLELTRDYLLSRTNIKKRKYANSIVPVCNTNLDFVLSERPDFVVNGEECTYLIEHFLIDICNDGPKNNQSESRRANREVFDIYKKYHDPVIGTIKDSDIEEATKDIEKTINKISNI